MQYASSYREPKNPRPTHTTVNGVRLLLTPIPWGWQVIQDGEPIGCVYRRWDYCSENEETQAVYWCGYTGSWRTITESLAERAAAEGIA